MNLTAQSCGEPSLWSGFFFSMARRSFAPAFWMIGLATVASPMRGEEPVQNHAKKEAPAPIPPDAPVITFDQTFFDFGKIPHGYKVFHRFKVSNTGKSTLHLTEVKANCGCTSTVVGKMNLEPGESTEIEAAFTPEDDFIGPVRKAIVVSSNAPAHPKLTLHFGADILPAQPTAEPAR
jgi:hypothetical protein